MAITTVALQTALGDGNPMGPQVIFSWGPNDGTFQDWYISGGTTVPGVVKHVRTTAADNAATQATAVLASLRLGPA
jgi:hypothetical protein